MTLYNPVFSDTFPYPLKLKSQIFIADSNEDIALNYLVSLLLDHFPGKENIDRAVEVSKKFEKMSQLKRRMFQCSNII